MASILLFGACRKGQRAYKLSAFLRDFFSYALSRLFSLDVFLFCSFLLSRILALLTALRPPQISPLGHSMIYKHEHKFGCQSCIRGHRGPQCGHRDRPLYYIRPTGRPNFQGSSPFRDDCAYKYQEGIDGAHFSLVPSSDVDLAFLARTDKSRARASSVRSPSTKSTGPKTPKRSNSISPRKSFPFSMSPRKSVSLSLSPSLLTTKHEKAKPHSHRKASKISRSKSYHVDRKTKENQRRAVRESAPSPSPPPSKLSCMRIPNLVNIEDDLPYLGFQQDAMSETGSDQTLEIGSDIYQDPELPEYSSGLFPQQPQFPCLRSPSQDPLLYQTPPENDYFEHDIKQEPNDELELPQTPTPFYPHHLPRNTFYTRNYSLFPGFTELEDTEEDTDGEYHPQANLTNFITV